MGLAGREKIEDLQPPSHTVLNIGPGVLMAAFAECQSDARAVK